MRGKIGIWGAAPGPVRLTYVAKDQSNTIDGIIYLGDSVQIGDLVVLFERVQGTSTSADPPTADWTKIRGDGLSTNMAWMYWKIITSVEAPVAYPGHALQAHDADTNTEKMVLIYRPNKPIFSVSVGGSSGQRSTSNPTAQTIAVTGTTDTILCFAHYAATGVISPRTSSISMSETYGASTNHYLKHKTYHASEARASFTVDMDDEGTNHLQSCFLIVK